MDPLKQNFISALNFSAKEKRGLAVVAVIMIAIWLTPEIIRYFSIESIQNKARVRYLEFKEGISLAQRNNLKEKAVRAHNLFDFDPNTASLHELEELGLPPRISARILKYREMGGRFRHKEDMLKIYGLDKNHYARIENHIVIFEVQKHNAKPVYERKVTDLNLADSAEFLSLPGIGPVFAAKIIAYREALGGFSDKAQLREVYGITDSLYQSLDDDVVIASPGSIRKIAINKADQQTLMKHPYFRKQAKIIVSYRDKHGPYKTGNDLKGIHVMNDSILEKILPYTSFE